MVTDEGQHNLHDEIHLHHLRGKNEKRHAKEKDAVRKRFDLLNDLQRRFFMGVVFFAGLNVHRAKRQDGDRHSRKEQRHFQP